MAVYSKCKANPQHQGRGKLQDSGQDYYGPIDEPIFQLPEVYILGTLDTTHKSADETLASWREAPIAEGQPQAEEVTMSCCLQDHIDQVTYWQPAGVKRYLAASSQNYVGLMEDGQTVLKYPLRKTHDALQTLRKEAERYIRLGSHKNLLTFKGLNDDGLLLEYCERGMLHTVLEGPDKLTDTQKITIGKQIVCCLVYLHDHHFIHCDLHVRNVFVTSDMSAKVGDLQGQLFRPDGSIEMETMTQENAKSRHPYAGNDEFSRRTDIFALGTLLYHLWHEHPPFPELDEFTHKDLIEARYRAGHYPINLRLSTGIESIIGKCWRSSYEGVHEVLDDMEKLDGMETQYTTVYALSP
ncbi:hypothetical protein AC578_2989 [Pseudocercospora eumusae]|uniref:Protein kinase domain-containing protein n=1 Tax=Pseudocercospora eumusae TaxID=321146 RepID=A0A139GX66_9PEZI|nr:hypothetical protein AC578_2989 [Pseudocercospora eumusae]